jgi:hypothetical protein
MLISAGIEETSPESIVIPFSVIVVPFFVDSDLAFSDVLAMS